MITWTDDGSGQQGSEQEAAAEVSNETAQADTDPAAAECYYEPDEPGQVHIDFVAETYAESEAEGEAVFSGSTDQAGAVPEDTGLDEIKDYDYSTLRDILKQNVAENAASVKEEASGSILLAGTAGFLGIHVLKAFLDSQEGKVYALVRRGNYASPQRRLMNLLMYYFDNPCDEYFGERIVCIEADIAEEKSLEKLKRYPFRTVINCTAGDGQPADGGTENLIAFCREMGRRLVQISTVSVAGTGTGELPGSDRLLAENELYIGQQLADEALRSKFLAERSVLEAAESGLDAKVIRVGNVAGRASDGEFQINFAENGFLRRVRAYAAVGMFPESMVNERVELSPVDSTAAAILRLAGTDKRFTVYHACNSNRISKGDFVHAMNNHGFDIQIVNDAEFVQALAAHEDSGLTAVPAAGAPEGGEESCTVGYENRFTTEVLQKLGYQWPETDGCYLEKVIDALDRLGFSNLNKEQGAAMGAFEAWQDFRLSVPARLEELEAVQSFFLGNGLVPDSLKKKLCLAAEEIFVNICSYAYGREQGSVDISMRISDRICVEFCDRGMEFHPLEHMVDVDGYDIDTQVGGLGRLLAVGLADHAEYTYRDGRNILTLIFHKEEPG